MGVKIVKSSVSREFGRNNRIITSGGSGGNSAGGGVISGNSGLDKFEADQLYHPLLGNITKDFKANNLHLEGNLNIKGEISNVLANTNIIDDALLKLNNGNNLVDSGIIIDDNTGNEDIRLFYKATSNKWQFGKNTFDNIAGESWTINNFLGKNDKAKDSDKLDGLQGSQFLRSDVNDNVNGTLTHTGSATSTVLRKVNMGDNAVNIFDFSNSDSGSVFGWLFRYIGTTSGTGGNEFRLQSKSTGTFIQFDHDGNLERSHSGGTWRYWHSGNDGSGSGLDADLLDGLHASNFLRSNANDQTGTGIRTWFGGNITGQNGSSARVQVNGFLRTGNIYLHSGGNTPNNNRNSDILGNDNGSLEWRSNTVWHQGNDGSGSGLDADLLDGLQGSQFLRSDANDTATGLISMQRSGEQFRLGYNINDSSPFIGFYDGTLRRGFLQVNLNGDIALQSDTHSANIRITGSGVNDLKHTQGGIQHTIWTAANDGSGSGLDADLLDGLQGSQFLRSDADDTATGDITFSGRVLIGGAPEFTTSDLSVRLTEGGDFVHIFNTNATQNANALFRIDGTNVDNVFRIQRNNEVRFSTLLQEHGTFTSGFGGSLWRLDPDDDGDSHLTVDRLTVRGRMDVYELVINQIRATNGSLWVSDAVKIDRSVERATQGIWDLFVNDDTTITLVANDIVRAQQFDGRNVRVFTGRVSGISTSDGRIVIVDTGGSQAWDGMELVRIGNSSVSNRQGSLYLTSSDSGAPFMDILDGVTGSSLSGHTRVRIGQLSGISGQSGYGIWGSRSGTEESFVISSDGYARIAGWNFDNYKIFNDINRTTNNTTDGAFISLCNTNDSDGSSFYGGRKLEGLALYWHRPGNAGTLTFGQVLTNRTTKKSGYYGIQMMNYTGKEYFCLAANTKDSLAAPYNKIASWDFDEKRIYRNFNSLSVNIGKSEWFSGWYGFELGKDSNNRLTMLANETSNAYQLRLELNDKEYFHLGSDGQRIAGFAFTDTKLYKDFGTYTVSIGDEHRSRSAVKGFHVANETGNLNRVSIGTTGSSWGLWGNYDGVEIFRLGDRNFIANWNFDSKRLWSKIGTNGVIEMNNSSNRFLIRRTDDFADGAVQMFYAADDNWGLSGIDSDGDQIFRLGSENMIAGLKFDNEKLYTNNLELNANTNILSFTQSENDTTPEAGLSFKLRNSSNVVRSVGNIFVSTVKQGSRLEDFIKINVGSKELTLNRFGVSINGALSIENLLNTEYLSVEKSAVFRGCVQSNYRALIHGGTIQIGSSGLPFDANVYFNESTSTSRSVNLPSVHSVQVGTTIRFGTRGGTISVKGTSTAPITFNNNSSTTSQTLSITNENEWMEWTLCVNPTAPNNKSWHISHRQNL